MADFEAPPKTHPATPLIVPFFILIVFGAIFTWFQFFLVNHPGLAEFLHNLILFFTGQITLGEVAMRTESPFLRALIVVFQLTSLFFVCLFIPSIIYATIKLNEAMAKMFAPLYQADKYDDLAEAGVPSGLPGAHAAAGASLGADGKPADMPQFSDVNPKWVKVLNHIRSDNQSDWRLAILEADIMLEEMLDKMGYPGQTLGERLKMVEKSDFDTIDMAWEAHKIRNQIAHEGSDLVLSKEQAERAITAFENVFREFKYI